MRARIFSCHHKVPEFERPTRLFCPILSGSRTEATHLGDLDGENQADNNSLSEIRHHYFVWKNLLGDYDHVGFEHYRRKFFINPYPGDEIAGFSPHGGALASLDREIRSNPLEFVHRLPKEAFDGYSTIRNGFGFERIRRIEHLIGDCDMILPVVFNHPVRDWWGTHHGQWSFDLIENAVRRNSYFDQREMLIDFAGARNLFWNIFILRADLFDEYMTFLFECLAEVLRHIEDGPRVTGYFCERFFSLWVYQKRREDSLLRVGHLPVVEYV